MRAETGRARRVNWKTVVGLMVSGVSLYVAIQGLHLSEAWRAFKQANYLWIAPAVVLYLLALVARTARWHVLLSSERSISLRELLPTMAMGRGANNVYPFRAGEIVRVLLLRQRNEVSAAAGLASILVERVFDGLTMILLLIAAGLIGGIPGPQQVRLFDQEVVINLRFLFWLAFGIFGLALGVVYTIVLYPALARRLAEWSIAHLTPDSFHAQLYGVVERFVGGFASIHSISALAWTLLFSIAVWGAETVSYRLLMNAFDFGVDLHYLLLMSGAANLGTALPSGPANVGTFDAPVILVLDTIGIPRAKAVSYQALLHTVLWCTETFAGLWFVWRSGLGKTGLDRTLTGRPELRETT